MSLMSISVSERRKEIGVRRSVGAARQHIVMQFLFEAVLVATGRFGRCHDRLGRTGAGHERLRQLPRVLLVATFRCFGRHVAGGRRRLWYLSGVEGVAH